MTPTADLAAQVLKIATALCKPTGLSVAAATQLTPAELASALTRGGCSKLIVGSAAQIEAIVCGGASGRRQTDTPRLRLVLDEADMLLAGVRLTGKEAGATPAARVLDTLRPASRGSGERGDIGNGKKSRKGGKPGKGVGGKGVGGKGGSKGGKRFAEVEPAAASSMAVEGGEGASGKPAGAHGQPGSVQLIFASATVPGSGTASVGAWLDARFPDAEWLRTKGAHRPVSTLTARFETIADETERRDALLRLVRKRQGRAVVFCNTHSRVSEAARLLEGGGKRSTAATDEPPLGEGAVVGRYQPSMDAAAREAALAAFAKAPDGVLVCSGLAARGMDLPAVALVVEFTLAPNLVEHMHRVGRTARAGREGTSVSLVCDGVPREQALVDEVTHAIERDFKFSL